MNPFMAFLMKYISGFFTWFQAVTKLPTIKYSDKLSVNWSIVAFMVIVWICMWLFLPS